MRDCSVVRLIPEPGGRAGRAGNHAAGLAQRRENLLALDLEQLLRPASAACSRVRVSAGLRSASGTLSSGPDERMTARSITFSSSRMLPGQNERFSASIVALGMIVMRRFSGRENLSTKWWTSAGMSSGRSRSAGTLHGKHIQPVVEIAAEQAVGDHLLEIAVGGRDQPHVNPLRPGASQPLELLLLQRAQQLGLNLRRDVPGFVEKQRAPIGELQPADLAVGGAGERASSRSRRARSR